MMQTGFQLWSPALTSSGDGSSTSASSMRPRGANIISAWEASATGRDIATARPCTQQQHLSTAPRGRLVLLLDMCMHACCCHSTSRLTHSRVEMPTAATRLLTLALTDCGDPLEHSIGLSCSNRGADSGFLPDHSVGCCRDSPHLLLFDHTKLRCAPSCNPVACKVSSAVMMATPTCHLAAHLDTANSERFWPTAFPALSWTLTTGRGAREVLSARPRALMRPWSCTRQSPS